jgi:lipopolysaccharide/colanic/teichoic acid biosynthesis glycosyltransferase
LEVREFTGETVRTVARSVVYESLKRFLDIVGSLVLIAVFSPFFLAAAVAIKLSSPGPLLVESCSRVGKNGKVFRMYKFRSMVPDAHMLIRVDPEFSELYEEYRTNGFKLQKDPRVTAVGQVLRSTSIDELPQFFNVLKGEMSLVGPRAFYPDELEESRELYPSVEQLIDVSLETEPGITGLWQVSGRSSVGFERRIEMDAEYARSKSLLLDLKILLKTPMAVLRREGAY